MCRFIEIKSKNNELEMEGGKQTKNLKKTFHNYFLKNINKPKMNLKNQEMMLQK